MQESTAFIKRTGKAAECCARWFCLTIIRVYRAFISPLKPPACRFYPSCSEYACQAIIKHGTFRGLLMALKRLSRCHPFNPGGYNPVE